MGEQKRFLLFDGNSVIHRAYHALPRLTTSKGELVNAIYGFLLVFFKTIKEFSPDYMAAAFDFPAPTFRRKVFKEYKSKRPPAPPDLYEQILKVKDLLSVFQVPVFEKEGFEADDIIGTVCLYAHRKQVIPPLEIIIVSGDKDVLQLVGRATRAYLLRRGVKDITLCDENSVKEIFWGLSPGQVADFKALSGDASDNIPGVTGIGPKTSAALISEFSTIDNLYEAIEGDQYLGPKISFRVKELLLKYKDQAFLSKQLALIDKNVPMDFQLSECAWGVYSKAEVASALEKLEFHSLIDKIPPASKTT